MRAAQLLEERAGDVLAANERDVDAAAATLDEGALDRLRLDEQRVATLARQLETTAALEPLEREISSRTLANGLKVRELRIPVGTIGANFEARPGVALDIAAQVLKSLNTIVLRTGGAALATVETLVDQVLRPALEAEGIDGGRGRARALGRSRRSRGARLRSPLDSARDPARQRRLDGGSRAPRGRQRRSHAGARRGRRRPLRPRLGQSRPRDGDRRLQPGPARRLQPAQPRLVDREAAGLAADARRGVRAARCRRRRDRPCSRRRRRSAQLDEPIGHEWASDPARVATVTLDIVDDLGRGGADREHRDLRARRRHRRRGRRGGRALLLALPRHRRLLAREHAVHRRLRADGHAGDRDQRRVGSGPARARHLPRPLAAPVPRRRRRHAASMRIVVKLGSSLVATSKGAVRRSLLAARATEVAALVAGGHSVCVVSSGAIALGAPRLGFERRPSTHAPAPGGSAVGQAQLQQAWERAFSRVGLQAAQILLSPADVADRQTYVNVSQHLRRAVPARSGPGRERERRDGHRRDHLRRQRRPGGAGRRAHERPAARAAHRGRRCLLAGSGNAGGGAARRRLARRPPSGWAAGPVSVEAAWAARSRPRSSPPAPASRP